MPRSQAVETKSTALSTLDLRAAEAVFTEPGHITNKANLQHEVNTEAGVGGCFPVEAPDEIGGGNPSPSAYFQQQWRNLCLAPDRNQKCPQQEDQESCRVDSPLVIRSTGSRRIVLQK